jgi:integrase/recombinase XerC/integrase/recombinase XerD
MSVRDIIKLNKEEITVTGNTSNWKEAVALFIASQDVKESSRNLYARTIKLFFEWVEANNRAIDTLTRLDILSFKDYQLERGLSSLSVGSYITSVRKFFEWAESEKIYPNIAKGVKTPARKQAFKKQHLTEQKSGELLQHFNNLSVRDYAIVNLILRTGLRTIEVVRANVEDITFMGNTRILRVWGKGRDDKEDFVILTEKAYAPIREYLKTRKNVKGNEPLFISNSHRNTGERLTTRTISGLCKSGLVAIGLDGREFTAHSLRHTTAVTILKQGGSLTDAQNVLRHANPATTQIYTASIKQELRLQNSAESLLDGAF